VLPRWGPATAGGPRQVHASHCHLRFMDDARRLWNGLESPSIESLLFDQAKRVLASLRSRMTLSDPPQQEGSFPTVVVTDATCLIRRRLLLFLCLSGLYLVFASIVVPTRLPRLCPLYRLTGIPCPACGLTRALGLVMRGNLKGAGEVNPAWAAFPTLMVMACGHDAYHVVKSWGGSSTEQKNTGGE
jgi:hypothetical protein